MSSLASSAESKCTEYDITPLDKPFSSTSSDFVPVFNWPDVMYDCGWLKNLFVRTPEALLDHVEKNPRHTPYRYYVQFRGMTAPVDLSSVQIMTGKELWLVKRLHEYRFIAAGYVVSQKPREGNATKALQEIWRVAHARGYSFIVEGAYNEGSRALMKKLGMEIVTWDHNSVKNFVLLTHPSTIKTDEVDLVGDSLQQVSLMQN